MAGLPAFALALGACFILLASPLVLAQNGAPAVINYQGRLYDPTGMGGPLTGTQQIEFRIYDSLSGGTLIWGRRFPVSCSEEGVFNVLLSDGGTWIAGATNALQAAFQGKTRYLELTVVGHGGAISPRQQLVSSPFALQSQYAVDAASATKGFTVSGGGLLVSGGATVSGATTICNALTVTAGGASVTGSVTLNDTLSVVGATTLKGAVTVTNNLTVTAPATIAGYGTIPIGCIVLWSGAATAIPDGWALCNGTTNNGHVTPNLTNRFVVGAGGAYAVGSTGGVDSVTLALNQIPSHTHTYTYRSSSKEFAAANQEGGVWTGTMSTNSGAVGGGQAHENRPLYYALCYIMRVK